MPSRYDALTNTLSDDDDDDDDDEKSIVIPSYENLSMCRADEETVLHAVYGDDFSSSVGTWGCQRLNVRVRPPDTPPSRIGSELTLSVQLDRRYPYTIPTIYLTNVSGLTSREQAELSTTLEKTAKTCASAGSVMMCELVQTTEDYLLAHNKDPEKQNVSAWEEMKARERLEAEAAAEKNERERRRAKDGEDEEDRGSFDDYSDEWDDDNGDGEPTTTTTTTMINRGEGLGVGDVEKELARQMEALGAVAARRRRRRDGADDVGDETHDLDDDDGDDFDLDDDESADVAPTAPVVGYASRYRTDFIELGLLGRGGGGEVQKVRNRLDRRLYAIKKIPLLAESEKGGRLAKYGAAQNRKLRREVTTISRMTHKNIVRYYQAWVEGGDVLDESDNCSCIEN